jgi:hypothetical protein
MQSAQRKEYTLTNGNTDEETMKRQTILIKRKEEDQNLETIYTRASEEMTNLFYEGFASEEIDDFENYLKRILANLAKHD